MIDEEENMIVEIWSQRMYVNKIHLHFAAISGITNSNHFMMQFSITNFYFVFCFSLFVFSNSL
jgi:hypothetical protein